MEIIGRTTADAVVHQTNAGKKVVHFSIAINDSYKPKGGTERKKTVTYINCSYWFNPGVATYITKGTLVECTGKIDAAAWINKQGEAKASLLFHVNSLKLHGHPGSAAQGQQALSGQPDTADDLPF